VGYPLRDEDAVFAQRVAQAICQSLRARIKVTSLDQQPAEHGEANRLTERRKFAQTVTGRQRIRAVNKGRFAIHRRCATKFEQRRARTNNERSVHPCAEHDRIGFANNLKIDRAHFHGHGFMALALEHCRQLVGDRPRVASQAFVDDGYFHGVILPHPVVQLVPANVAP
jgi:hypothetical protein